MEIKKNENVYENAELKVIHLTETDIITTSGYDYREDIQGEIVYSD